MRLSLRFALAACASLFVRNALACAPAPPSGEQVTTQREDALIVWDEREHREHFIRRAVFGSSSKAFGFLVPTPAAPELAEVSEHVFDFLDDLTKPAVVTENKLVAVPIGCTALPFLALRSGSKSSTPPQALEAAAAVTVLEQKRVAGLDASVLDADNADALAEWLRTRGFAFRDELKGWVSPYLSRHWKITAFRYAADEPAATGTLASAALRMSFATEAPVYPYREPADQPSVAGRELRLFVAGSNPLRASLDAGATPAWSAVQRFSASVSPSNDLRSALNGLTLPNSLWLQEFRDSANLRPRADLIFHVNPDRSEVRPAPIVIYHEQQLPLPYELPFVLGGAVWFWRKRRARAELARSSA